MKDKIYSTLSFLSGLLFAGPSGYIIRRNIKDNNKILSFKLDINQQTPEEAVKVICESSKILENIK